MGSIMHFVDREIYELFIIPDPENSVVVMAKISTESAQIIRGPDHHGRIVYEHGAVSTIMPDTIVQKIDKQCIRDHMS